MNDRKQMTAAILAFLAGLLVGAGTGRDFGGSLLVAFACAMGMAIILALIGDEA